MFKKLIIACLLVGSLPYWGNSKRLDVRTAVPVEAEVCGDSVLFTLTVRNDTTTIADSLEVNPVMPQGMQYVRMVQGGPFSFTGAQFPNEPHFFASQLLPGDSVKLQFYAKACCDFVGLSSSPLTADTVNNATRVSYIMNGQNQIDYEYFRSPFGSKSYNIIRADLTILNVTPVNSVKEIGDTVCRTISIRNGGLGTLAEWSLVIAHEGEVDFLFAESGDPNVALSATNRNDTTWIRVVHANRFGSNAQLDIRVYETMSRCNPPTNTSYTASWGCCSMTCNAGNGNAVSSANVSAPTGKPNLTYTSYQILDPACWGCPDSTGTVVLRFENLGNADALNAEFEIGPGKGANSWYDSIKVNGYLLPDSLVDSNYVRIRQTHIGGTHVYSVKLFKLTWDPDGPGGLDDLNGDGIYDDVAPGEKVEICFNVNLRCPPVVGCNRDWGHQFVTFRRHFEDRCGNAYRQTSWKRLFDLQVGFRSNRGSGPTDIHPGDTALFYVSTFRRPDWFYAWRNGFIQCPNGSIFMEIELDQGLKLVGDTVYIKNRKIIPKLVGNKILVNYGNAISHWYGGAFAFNLTLDCQAGPPNPAMIKWRMFYQSDTICKNCQVCLGNDSMAVYTHCPLACYGAKATGIEKSRINFGFTDSTFTTKVNIDTPNIRKDLIYPCDTLQLNFKGVIGGGSFDSLVAILNFSAPDTLLGFVDGFWSVNGLPCNIPINASNLVRSASGQSPINFNWEFFLPQGCGSVSPGDSVRLNIRIRGMNGAIPSYTGYQFHPFRISFAGIDSLGIRHACGSYGDRFWISRVPTGLFKWSDFLVSCDPVQLSFNLGSIPGAINTLGEDFPNEIRPVVDLIDTIIFTIPKHYNYVPGSFSIRVWAGDYRYRRPNVEFRSAGPLLDTLYFIRTDGWPLADVSGEHHWGSPTKHLFRFKVEPKNCSSLKINYRDTLTGYLKWWHGVHTQDPNCRELFERAIKIYLYPLPALIKLDPGNAVQDGFKRETVFEVSYCNRADSNESIGDSDYNWIAFQPRDPGFQVTEVRERGNNTPLPLLPYGNHGVWVKPGALSANTCKTFDVVTRYQNCILNDLDTIDITGGPTCDPNLPHPDSAACYAEATQIAIRYKTANLQFYVEDSSRVPFDKCDSLFYQFRLRSSAPGRMYDVKAGAVLPVGLDYIPGTAFYQYPAGGAWQPLPGARTFGSGMRGWDLAALVFSNAQSVDTGFVGVRDTNRNEIRIRFQLRADCDFQPGSRLAFRAEGVTNCNTPTNLDYFLTEPLLVRGFPPADTLSMNLITSRPNCNSPHGEMKVVIRNNGSVPTGNFGGIQLTLPSGVVYNQGYFALYNAPNHATFSNSGRDLYWKLPAGVQGGDSVVWKFYFLWVDSLCMGGTFCGQTFIQDSVVCPDTACLLRQQTASVCVQDTHCVLDPGFTTLDLCEGLPVTFLPNHNNGGFHFWDFGDGTYSGLDTARHLYQQTGTYILRHEYWIPGCDTVSERDTVSIWPKPYGVIKPKWGSFPLCFGDSACLTIDSLQGMGIVVHWYRNGQPVHKGDSLLIRAAGLYTATLVDTNGCANQCPGILISQRPQPPQCLKDTIICKGDSVFLKPCSGMAGYWWHNGARADSIKVSSAGQYVVHYLDYNRCVGSDTVSVQVNDPQLTLPDTVICFTDSVCFDAGPGFVAWLWNDGLTGSLNCPDTTGRYWVRAWDSVGCEVADTFMLQVDSLPNAAFDSMTICKGDTLSFNAIDENGWHEWWVETGTLTAYLSGQASFAYSWASPGMYQVKHVHANACGSDTAIRRIRVLPAPVASPLLIGTNPFCEGDSVCLTVQPDSSHPAPIVVVDWYKSTTFIGSGDTIKVNQPGTYRAVVTDSNGCSDFCPSITLQTKPNPQFSLPDTAYICGNQQSIQLQAIPGNYIYTWSNGDTGSVTVVSQIGWVWVEATDSSQQCPCLRRDSVWVTRDTLKAYIGPHFCAYCSGHPFTLTGAPAPGPYLYTWLDAADTIQHGTSNLMHQTINIPWNQYFIQKTYSLVVTDTLTGCSDTTTRTIPITKCSIKPFRLLPNPASSPGQLTIVHEFGPVETIRMDVIDLNGKAVARYALKPELVMQTIDFPLLTGGIYFVKFEVDGMLYRTERIVIMAK